MKDLVDKANSMVPGTLMETLGMKFTAVKAGYVEAVMTIDHRTVQPFGYLHGGASAALAETLGSFGSHLLIAESGAPSFGIELNINHIKSLREGIVTGKARILHQGKTLHVWNIDIEDEQNNLVATSRLTVMVRNKS